MKHLLTGLLGLVLFAAMGSIAPSNAFTLHPPLTSLNGCYSFLLNSIDTNPERQQVGTLCFNGAGAVVGGVNNTGICTNTAGVTHCGNFHGAYKITDTPGDGMGVITLTSGGCTITHEISIFNWNGIIALGLNIAKVSPSPPPCPNTVDMIGGVAVYQNP
jgi:hypothetical protein